MPETMVLPLERFVDLRYGENPHQEGAIYRISGAEAWWGQARVLQGKEMSFNNYADAVRRGGWYGSSPIRLP